MRFTISVSHLPDLLVVAGSGPATLGDLCGLFDFVRVASNAQGHSRALLDLRLVEIAFSFTDHLALGSHAASELKGLFRVASVVDPKFRVGTSEKAAQKMGLPFQTFTDIEEAKRWIAGISEGLG
jgi:hypothetical protein